jgi:hypothetical protein
MDERKRHLSDSFDHTSTLEGGSSGNTPPSKKHANLFRDPTTSGMAISTGLAHEIMEQETSRTSRPVSPYTATANGPSDTMTEATDGQEKSPAVSKLFLIRNSNNS